MTSASAILSRDFAHNDDGGQRREISSDAPQQAIYPKRVGETGSGKPQTYACTLSVNTQVDEIILQSRPPPLDARVGSKHKPSCRLTEWVLINLRKRFKKGVDWNPPSNVLLHELGRLGRITTAADRYRAGCQCLANGWYFPCGEDSMDACYGRKFALRNETAQNVRQGVAFKGANKRKIEAKNNSEGSPSAGMDTNREKRPCVPVKCSSLEVDQNTKAVGLEKRDGNTSCKMTEILERKGSTNMEKDPRSKESAVCKLAKVLKKHEGASYEEPSADFDTVYKALCEDLFHFDESNRNFKPGLQYAPDSHFLKLISLSHQGIYAYPLMEYLGAAQDSALFIVVEWIRHMMDGTDREAVRHNKSKYEHATFEEVRRMLLAGEIPPSAKMKRLLMDMAPLLNDGGLDVLAGFINLSLPLSSEGRFEVLESRANKKRLTAGHSDGPCSITNEHSPEEIDLDEYPSSDSDEETILEGKDTNAPLPREQETPEEATRACSAEAKLGPSLDVGSKNDAETSNNPTNLIQPTSSNNLGAIIPLSSGLSSSDGVDSASAVSNQKPSTDSNDPSVITSPGSTTAASGISSTATSTPSNRNASDFRRYFVSQIPRTQPPPLLWQFKQKRQLENSDEPEQNQIRSKPDSNIGFKHQRLADFVTCGKIKK